MLFCEFLSIKGASMAKVFGRLIEGNCSGEYGRLVVAACFVLMRVFDSQFGQVGSDRRRHESTCYGYIKPWRHHHWGRISRSRHEVVQSGNDMGNRCGFTNKTGKDRDVAHINASTIVAIGGFGSYYLSTSRGTTWIVVKTLTNTYPKLGLYCSPRGRVWVTCNDGEVVYSDDTCKSWKSVLPGYPNSVAGQLRDIEFSDQQLTGWIVLRDERSLLRTTDGGINWKVVPIAIADRAVLDCRFRRRTERVSCLGIRWGQIRHK